MAPVAGRTGSWACLRRPHGRSRAVDRALRRGVDRPRRGRHVRHRRGRREVPGRAGAVRARRLRRGDGACAGYGGWQAQPPNPSGAVGLQYTLDTPGGLLPPEWRSRAGLPVITLAGCPVPADTQVAALRWALSGAPGGPGRYGTAPMVQPCLATVDELPGCGHHGRSGCAARAAPARSSPTGLGPTAGTVGCVSGQHAHEEVPRSEGDLRICWDERDGRIDAAWCRAPCTAATKMILIGRGPEDVLATTARLCGICSTSHVVAATHALEDAWNIVPPAQAVRLRNLFLAAESLMSDARQGALFFGPGLCDSSFSGHDLYDEIVQAFRPPFVGWYRARCGSCSDRMPRRHHGLHPGNGRTRFPSGRVVPPARSGGRRSPGRAALDDYWRTGMPRPSSAAASRMGSRRRTATAVCCGSG